MTLTLKANSQLFLPFFFWDNQEYSCCQGLICDNIMSMVPMQDSMPGLCLCLESCFCTGIAMSVNRIVVMQNENIMPDPCDGHLIMLSNFCQCLACVCETFGRPEDADCVRWYNFSLLCFLWGFIFELGRPCYLLRLGMYERNQFTDIIFYFLFCTRWF